MNPTDPITNLTSAIPVINQNTPNSSPPNLGQLNSNLGTNRSVVKLIGAIIAVMVVFMIVVFAAVFIALSGPVKVANEQFNDIKTGNYQAAYDLFTTNAKDQTSIDTFQSNFVQFRITTDKNSRLIFNNRRIVNNVAELTGALISNGASRVVVYTLVQENGTWKISTIDLKSL